MELCIFIHKLALFQPAKTCVFSPMGPKCHSGLCQNVQEHAPFGPMGRKCRSGPGQNVQDHAPFGPMGGNCRSGLGQNVHEYAPSGLGQNVHISAHFVETKMWVWMHILAFCNNMIALPAILKTHCYIRCLKSVGQYVCEHTLFGPACQL
jgi:hypothetical protein